MTRRVLQGEVASLRRVLPDPEAVVAKSELRLRLLTRRTERPDAERAAAAEALTRALLVGLAGARTVAAFVPDPIEPGTGLLPEAYARLGARILLPVVPDVGRELRWAVAHRAAGAGPVRTAGAGGSAAGAGRDRRGGRRRRPGARGRPGRRAAGPGWRVLRPGAAPGPRRRRPRGPASSTTSWSTSLPAEPHDRLVTAVVTPSGGWQALPAGR